MSRAQPEPFHVTVNGRLIELEPDASITDLMGMLAVPATGTAVELDGEVVPTREWADRRLGPGQRIEIVRMVGGG